MSWALHDLTFDISHFATGAKTVYMDNDLYIALGANMPSNAGLPDATLRAALGEMAARGLSLQAVSRFFATPAVPSGSGPDYLNACCRLASDRSPGEVLQILHEIEAEFGRVREGRWQARGIDLDLIAMGDAVLPDPTVYAKWRDLSPQAQLVEAPDHLVLPHPRLQDRAFVLIPLADIAPLWRHPVSGLSVVEMLEALPEDEKAAIRPLLEAHSAQ